MSFEVKDMGNGLAVIKKVRAPGEPEKVYTHPGIILYPAVEFDENGQHIGGRFYNMINTDGYYEIGAGHVFCQDYADHGRFVIDGKPFRYAIVCDGCSGSKGSDVGARMLAKWFPEAFKKSYELNALVSGNNPEDFVGTELIAKIKKNDLGVPLENYDATVVALVYEEIADTLYMFAWGDGKVLLKYKKDEIAYLTDIHFTSNAPYYLSYGVDANRDVAYEKTFGKDYADVTPIIIKPDGWIPSMDGSKFRQKSFFEKYEKASETLSYASVFTDGVDTFHAKDDVNKVMPKHNVFNQLTQYKATNGDFVQRRMNAVKKFCQKEGWQHFDDIAIATITF